jgi:hypothetical protein
MIVLEIFPLHGAARSQIFLLHFAVGRCDSLLHHAAGSQISPLLTFDGKKWSWKISRHCPFKFCFWFRSCGVGRFANKVALNQIIILLAD